jgi:hypothetical protein
MAQTWTLNYEPAEGGRLTGKLTVDEEKLHFVALYDSSNAAGIKTLLGAAAGLAATGGHLAYIRNNDAQLELELPRAEIENVATKKKLFAKRVIVTMRGGHDFVFNYGMLSVDKLAKAIEP